jgi:tRNA A37 methylthiotransferase MiaB
VDKKKIFIATSGVCWKRSLDAGKIKNYLLKNDYKITESLEKSDIIILVTCAFLNGKSANSHEKVKDFLKEDAEVIVAGCLPTVEKEKLKEYFSGEIIETKNIKEDIEKIFPPTKISFKDVEDANILFEDKTEKSSIDYLKIAISKSNFIKKNLNFIKNHVLKHLIGEDSPAYKFSEKQFHVRVAWGCTGNCSYCTIKKSTGSFYSKPFDICVKEFKKGLNEGYKNFVLDATDLGAYGIDINSSFTELLDKFTDYPGSYYINIRELNARWITRYNDELVRILEKNKILLFDIAIQSASPRILKLMNRPYDVEKLKNSLLKIRKVDADFSLTCEFIVGFPTETEEEFIQSLNFIKDVGFDGGQLYEFSLRPGTEAENIEPKISQDVILKRINYAKKFLKKNGYYAKHLPEESMLVFTRL